MKIKFEFQAKKASNISDSEAQEYGQRLYELMKELGKKEIQPREVVADARNKNSVYHNYFTWDDAEASEQYRLYEARHLMNSIVKVKIIECEEEPIITRAFHNIVIEDNEGTHKAYVPEEIVFGKEEYGKQVIENALQEARSWNNRYKTYSELSRISTAIDITLGEYYKEKAKV